jgi:hypothetical protein
MIDRSHPLSVKRQVNISRGGRCITCPSRQVKWIWC